MIAEKKVSVDFSTSRSVWHFDIIPLLIVIAYIIQMYSTAYSSRQVSKK